MQKRYDWFFLVLISALAFAYQWETAPPDDSPVNRLRADVGRCLEQLNWTNEHLLIEGHKSELRVSLLGPHRLATRKIVQKLLRSNGCRVLEWRVAPPDAEEQGAEDFSKRWQHQVEMVMGPERVLLMFEGPQTARFARFGEFSELKPPSPSVLTGWLLTSPDLNRVNPKLTEMVLKGIGIPPAQLHTVALERFCNTPATPENIP